MKMSEKTVKDIMEVNETLEQKQQKYPQLTSLFWSFPTVEEMRNNKCFCCPADRQGNRCSGKEFCNKTWNRYNAIVNQEWHHVSLKTLANIDYDMLDEKRRLYMKVYRMTANVINSIYKCNRFISIDNLRTNLLKTVRNMAKNGAIEWALVEYVKAKLDNCYLVKGLSSSIMAKTYNYNESRSYTKTFSF